MENKPTEELIDNFNDLNITETEDTVDGSAGDQIANWKGYLNEQAQKKRIDVKFYPAIKSGRDHTPEYEVTCLVTYGGEDILGVGVAGSIREAEQIAAKEAADKWKIATDGDDSQESVGNINSSTENKELQKFYNNLVNNEELADNLRNVQITFENILSSIGCKSEMVLGNTTNSALLKIMLKDNESIAVMNLFSVSDRCSDEAVKSVKQKAVSIIKILIEK